VPGKQGNEADDSGVEAGPNGHGNAHSRAQRERLIEAFTKVAAERGYAETTVEKVTSRAGVPSGAFDVHFANKRQCLGAAYDAFVARLIGEVQAAIDADDEWPLQVKEAVAATLEFVGETKGRARFFAVEALDAGPVILERFVSARNMVASMLRRGREHYPQAAQLPEMTEPILVGGAAFLLSGILLEEEQLRVARLEAELVEILLTPYIGGEEARRIAA
jgi:AcrR family transcriptional regulator